MANISKAAKQDIATNRLQGMIDRIEQSGKTFDKQMAQIEATYGLNLKLPKTTCRINYVDSDLEEFKRYRLNNFIYGSEHANDLELEIWEASTLAGYTPLMAMQGINKSIEYQVARSNSKQVKRIYLRNRKKMSRKMFTFWEQEYVRLCREDGLL